MMQLYGLRNNQHEILHNGSGCVMDGNGNRVAAGRARVRCAAESAGRSLEAYTGWQGPGFADGRSRKTARRHLE